MIGEEFTANLKYIASDMWKSYRNVIFYLAPKALHVLDRFHIVVKINNAVDEVRAQEAREMKRKGYYPILKNSRWCFLKRTDNLKPSQKEKLRELLQYSLRSVRAYMLKESFQAFWQYNSTHWPKWFLSKWCTRAMRSRLDPIKVFVKTIRNHEDLMLNWFRAKKQISSGTAEALNGNAKLTIRKAGGTRGLKRLK